MECAIYFGKGNLEVMKKAIISGIVFCSILLVGCNTTEVLESEQEVVGGDEGISNLISELKNEIIVSITEQTELESDSLAIMIDGGTDELTVSVGFPKDAKIDDTLIQQIVEDSIKNVSETETETISEEKMKIKIKIEKY
ncbi:topoisomerase [Psychrobacillus sp. NEAU-3TGS]|uniref:topoisomerase n=1 Tax=Psychrobacillus sp. NEAU-3TGS TaxID=2995412 RepID=UPI0024964F33|nr:topoisomerase [Psychrobacillus sp. NEAU-3TGS]MDI2587051.1 topoisomerase [Psychrobacillus sp. NEAU-3TGS]